MVLRFSESVMVIMYELSEEERQIKRDANSVCRNLKHKRRNRKRPRDLQEDNDKSSEDNDKSSEHPPDEENTKEMNVSDGSFGHNDLESASNRRKKIKGIYFRQKEKHGYTKPSMLPANWANKYSRYRRSTSSIMGGDFIFAI